MIDFINHSSAATTCWSGILSHPFQSKCLAPHICLSHGSVAGDDQSVKEPDTASALFEISVISSSPCLSRILAHFSLLVTRSDASDFWFLISSCIHFRHAVMTPRRMLIPTINGHHLNLKISTIQTDALASIILIASDALQPSAAWYWPCLFIALRICIFVKNCPHQNIHIILHVRIFSDVNINYLINVPNNFSFVASSWRIPYFLTKTSLRAIA